ncbi:MAG: response regulator transcription factor [Spirochaetales bacterium]|nr:response regulator transcription factor [Spirochaetales bacterium]
MDDHPLRVIVAEDEAPAREEMIHLLEENGSVEIVGEARDGGEALKLILREKPDLALLDIEMPGLTGMEAAREVIRHNIPTQIIFTTAYSQFALEAFEVNAIDYLLKPIRQSKLDKALDKVRNNLPDRPYNNRDVLKDFLNTYLDREKEPVRFLSVYQGEKIIPLKISSIHFAEARGRFVIVVTDEGEFRTNLNFHQAEEKLKPPEFFVCHRSFIIRPESVESIDLWVNSSYRLKMKGSRTPVPVSRSRKDEFRDLMGI